MKTLLSNCLAIVAAIGLCTAAIAEDALFKEHIYGAPFSTYSNQAGYYDCSAEIGATALCVDDVKFVGHSFTAALLFSGEKLYMVSLLSSFEQQAYVQAVAALAKSFALVSLADANSQLDLLDLDRQNNRQDFAAKLSSYESVAANAGNLTYTFIEGLDRAKKHPNVTTAVAAAKDNTRAAELVIMDDGADSILAIRFSFPKLEARKLQDALASPVEDF
ncbi:hypothetical protein G7015_17170 [Pseudomonas kunmingensis]|uniref:hypothetical protein n=1 Tax=Stutzerimonas stutzeri TaxID=316 RepID=UPI0002549BB4|nr:hypothetical protein [Stutzerimonas stutzeri]EHY79641.1 hypothetical protein PstZobell_19668 [Stutzerimonas stutzeri ATCC 14405 = CCUG 16156]KRW68781.1 hypothetical protein AO741_19545 [Pseudomonas sp. TTU2014-105ASC]MBA1240197.1 hypothetical protein [Stutzerimonas kunmingensis]QOZ95506.1 hypothetical protein Pstu14405_09220 [Stutzerimonas stutzeri]